MCARALFPVHLSGEPRQGLTGPRVQCECLTVRVKSPQNVCVSVWYANVCMLVFFLRGSGAGPAFLKGARQLPFTATGGHKQRGRGGYLPLLLGKKPEEGFLLRSHCNSTQLQDERRIQVGTV